MGCSISCRANNTIPARRQGRANLLALLLYARQVKIRLNLGSRIMPDARRSKTGAAREKPQVRGAAAIAGAEMRRNDFGLGMARKRVRPRTFLVLRVHGIPYAQWFCERAQIINVPLQFFRFVPMPHHASAQSARAARAADIHIIPARKIERAEFADFQMGCAWQIQKQRVRAAPIGQCIWIGGA